MSAPDTRGDNLLQHLRRLAREKRVEVDQFVLPREGHVHTGRLRQHYLDWGNEHAIPLVFMHAGRLNAHSWDLVSLALRRDYRCLALDLAGHGESEWAADGDYRVSSCAEDLRGFADALGLERFLLAGLSMGGMHSLAFASRYSARLLGLAVMDIGPEVNPEGTRRQRNSVAVFEPMASFDDFVALALADRPSRDVHKLRFTLAQNVRQRPDGKWVWQYDTENRSRRSDEAIAADRRYLADVVAHIDCPAIVIRGADSDILLREHASNLAANLQDGRWMEIPGARHFLHQDNPVAVIDALRGFFAEVSGAALPSKAS